MKEPTVRTSVWRVSVLVLAGVIVTSIAHHSLASDDAGDHSLTITGTITDAGGEPLADAKVSMIYDDSSGARVVSETTKVEGRYRFDVMSRPRGNVSIVAWKEGHACGLAQHQRGVSRIESMPGGSTIELPIELPIAKPLSLAIVDADGNAVRGGSVSLCGSSVPDRTASFYWNEPRLEFSTRKIDATGRVTIDYLPQSYGATLLVDTDGNGRQRVSVGRGRVANGATIQLLPPSRMHITLSADDPSAIADRDVVVHSRPEKSVDTDDPSKALRVKPSGTIAALRTDAAGKLSAVMSAGTASVYVQAPPGARQFPKEVPPVVLEAGGSTHVKIEFEPGIRVHGSVSVDGTDPVPGVELMILNSTVCSDEDGRFEAWVPASGYLYGIVVDVPSGFAWPFDDRLNIQRPPDDTSAGPLSTRDLEIPDILVTKAVPVFGTVVNASGKPVSTGRVSACWMQSNQKGSYTFKSDTARTDSVGRYQLQHLWPDVDIRLTARTNDASTRAATTFHTSQPREVELQVTSDAMVKLTGNVMGSDGGVIPGATVKISRALTVPEGNVFGLRALRWNGKETFQTDRRGQFESPGMIPRFDQYSIAISAPGYLARETPFLKPPTSGSTFPLAETVLTKARATAGVVRDSSGEAVAGAVVSAYTISQGGRRSRTVRTKVSTDSDGRFTFDQLHPRAAMAVAEKNGYQISGCPLMIDSPNVVITLLRTDESLPPEEVIRPVWDNQRRHAAANHLLTKMLPTRRASRYFHAKAIEMMARFQPEAVLAEVAKSTSASTRAKTLAMIGEIEDSLAEAETIPDAYGRAYLRFGILDRIEDPDRSRDVLATTLVDADLIRRPDQRILVIAMIAERFAKLGDREQAERILKAELPRAFALSTQERPGDARGAFAERLSQFDPQKAFQMISQADEEDRTEHLQNVAHILAGIQPEMAEAAIDRIGDHLYTASPVIPVVYRMATVDLPRALRLLERIDRRQRPTEPARGLAVIAYALKDKDRARAKELLQQAVDSLPQQSGGGGYRADDIFGASMTLLRFAEEIDPDNLSAYYWHTIKNYPGPNAGAWSPDDTAAEDCDRQSRLAFLLSLYEHPADLLQQIMGPVFEYWEGQIGENTGSFADCRSTFMAMALADPERAVDWSIRFDQKLGEKPRRRIPQPWQVIGDTLTCDRVQLGKTITRKVFHKWVIDADDL